jgi:hypothetical protein
MVDVHDHLGTGDTARPRLTLIWRMLARSIGSTDWRERIIAATHVLRLISYPVSSSAFTIASACLIATRASTLCPLSLTCSARTPSDHCNASALRCEKPRGRAASRAVRHVGEDSEESGDDEFCEGPTRRTRGVLHLGIGRGISRHNEAPLTYSRATGRRRSSCSG